MCAVSKEPVISCQLSFYPLGREDYLADIDAVLRLVEQSGLRHTVGGMATTVTGRANDVFALLHQIAATARCPFSMPLLLSNTCGVP